MKPKKDEPGREGMERSTGRAIKAWQPKRGSTVELGNGYGAKIYSSDDWIVGFEDKDGPFKTAFDLDENPQFEHGGPLWHYSGPAFKRHFMVF
jgi:hypothetical protein